MVPAGVREAPRRDDCEMRLRGELVSVRYWINRCQTRATLTGLLVSTEAKARASDATRIVEAIGVLKSDDAMRCIKCLCLGQVFNDFCRFLAAVF